MIEYPNLIPECNVDTVFVKMLGYKEPNHAPNINDVFKIFEQKKKTPKIIGFVDDDKRMSGYLLAFGLKDKINKVRLLKHSEREHYLVVVNPAMDRFIFDLCRSLNIDITKYKLPGEFDAFKSLTKKVAIRKNNNFKQLLNTIIQKEPEEIVMIKSWVSKFSPYKL